MTYVERQIKHVILLIRELSEKVDALKKDSYPPMDIPFDELEDRVRRLEEMTFPLGK